MQLTVALSLAAAATLACNAIAQVPYGFLVTAESNNAPDGFRIIDPATGAVTEVSEPDGNFLGGAQCVAVEPGTNAIVTSAGGSFGGAPIWNVPLTNNYYYFAQLNGQSLNLFGSLARMYATPTETLFTLSSVSDGLYTQSTIPGNATLLAPLTNATDIAVIAGKAYVNSYQPGQLSTIIEVDLSSGTVVTLGSTYSTVRSLGTVGSSLIAGRDDGGIDLIDLTNGMATPFMATGLGSLTAIVAGPTGTTYIATASNSIYDINNLAAPIYASPYTLKDFDVSFDDQATQLIYGSGCAGAGTIPEASVTAAPALGTTYTISMTGAAGNAIGGCVLGLGRGNLNLTSIGFPGCTLVSDFQLIQTVVTSLAGDASVSLSIPITPALTGTHINGQYFVLETGGMLAMSQGIEGHIR